MKYLVTFLTFVGVFIVAAFVRGVTGDVTSSAIVNIFVSAITLFLLFLVPYKVFKSFKD
ncbi:hypothetical protein SAMN04487964_10311 [Marinobacterium sediminicola]|uniref:DUF1328 domain-containing protein n=1 Tax=Marinobacterium sediminicola TaxID=518898 RepID=A0ABY1RXW2_9GAMM|nr:hypothetical protein SAMN04487964_10311 [Marinobacterium sediminicola]